MKQDSQKQKNKTTGKPCVNIYTRRIFRAFDDGIGDDTWFTHLPAWPWGSWKIESLISSEVTASVWHHNSRNWKWNCPDTITEKWFLVQELNLLQGRRVLGVGGQDARRGSVRCRIRLIYQRVNGERVIQNLAISCGLQKWKKKRKWKWLTGLDCFVK